MLWKQPDSSDSIGVRILQQAERPPAAQAPVDQHLRDGERHADGQERERGGRHGDVEREFPARPARRRSVARAFGERGLEHGGDREQQCRHAAPAGPQGHHDGRDGDHEADDRGRVAERERRGRGEAALVQQRGGVHDRADRRDRDRGDAPAATLGAVDGADSVRREAEPDGSDEVAGDGDQWQQQARGPGVAR